MLFLFFGCCCGGWLACAWGNLLELSVWAFLLLLFLLLCIAFLALIICGEVKLSFAVFESNNSIKTQVGENMNAKSFVLLDCQVVYVIIAGIACIFVAQ